MEAKDTIAIGYNRQMLRQHALYLSSLFLTLFAVFVFFILTDKPHHTWLPTTIFCIIFVTVTSQFPVDSFHLISCYWHNLFRHDPAFIVQKSGLSVNATGNLYGLLEWEEIERIHPWTMEHRFFSNPLFKTPLISREPGIAIVFKENLAIKRSPWMRRLFTKREAKSGPGSWLFIPEALLAVTAIELINQINQFYITQVRGY